MSLIEDLANLLEKAQRELACANMIDNFDRRKTQMKHWQAEVDRLEREIADAEVGFNRYGSGPSPIEGREG